MITYSTRRGLVFWGIHALLLHFYINFVTDFQDGRTDPLGPYPRIPDKEKIKKEIEFANECKKYMTGPKQTFL